MNTPWIAALVALFAWWFFTGAILFAVRRADRAGGDTPLLIVVCALPVLALGLAGANASAGDPSVAGAYTGFFAALCLWGWIELAFLAGILTGPERRPCPPGLRGAARFHRAWATVAHHEAALLAGLLLLAVMTGGAQNPVAVWTYAVLFGARISAKLNLFFGVPRINTEFVPRRLAHLPSYFRKGQATPAFPVAITLLSFATALFLERTIAAPDPGRSVAFALLAALSALALLEHWLMILPLPDAKLWRWMLPAPGPDPTAPRSSGKTTHGL